MDMSLHFLVVDDDAESRATVVEYLRSLGYGKVTLAHDGAEAYRQLERDPTINFIISDWDMPLMNGLSLLQRVKSHPTRSAIPFVVMTSPISHEAEKVILAAESMVNAYLVKPFRSQVLKDKIEAILDEVAKGLGKRVVVVDDDADAQAMVVEYVKQMGFRDVVTFSNGMEALKYLISNGDAVGLVISDWEMPEMTGIELLKSCKAHPDLVDMPFLMITSQSSIERMKVMQAARSSVDEYLLKPFSGVEIRKRVETLLERSQSHGAIQQLLAEATAFQDQAKYAQAQNKFEEILKLHNEYEPALRGMGDVLTKLKGGQAALPFYKRAVEAAPTIPKSYIKLAAAYDQLGLQDKAVALLQTANRQISFNADLHFLLGKLYLKRNQVAEAKTEFEKTLEIQVDHQEARLMLDSIGHRRKE